MTVIETKGGSDQLNRRHFCPNCGSSVLGEPYRSGMINVMAGTLDEPSIFVPTTEVFRETMHDCLQDGSQWLRYPRNSV